MLAEYTNQSVVGGDGMPYWQFITKYASIDKELPNALLITRTGY